MNSSPLIIGTMRWGLWGAKHSAKSVQQLIETALKHNLTTFDHADIYGGYTTEKLFGDAWREMNIPREDVQFISKCGIENPGGTKNFEIKTYNYTQEYILSAVDASLQNLNTDYLDMLLLHRPSPLMNPTEIAQAFKKLLQQGKVRHFGVSNFTPSQFDLIDEYFPIIQNQIEISINHRNAMIDGTLDHMMLHNIRPMAWSPLGNYFTNNSNENQRIQNVLQPLCQKYNAEEDQILLAWLTNHPAGITPVIGTSDANRITKAYQSLDINLERTDWFKLWIAATGKEVP